MRFLVFAVALIAFPAVAAPICTDASPGGKLPISLQSGPTLCNEAYVVQESLSAREPLWSAEHLTEEHVESARALTGRAPFRSDLRLEIGARSELDDYKRSGWSRGHMTPSGDAPDRASRAQTFLLSNVVPQNGALNSGAWDKIERAVRTLATDDGEVYVVTGPAFHENLGTIGPDHIRIPSSVWKAVYDPSEKSVAIIVCKNQTTPSCGQVPYTALVSATGVDPFPALSADIKARDLSVPGWNDLK